MDRKLYGNRTLSPLFQTTTNRPFVLCLVSLRQLTRQGLKLHVKAVCVDSI